jgi:dTDP-4-dehydrorhamnose reductase
MKILITGGNGFLGQHLCKFLKEDHEIFAISTGDKRIPFDDVRYNSVDITDANNLNKVFEDVQPDVVIHAAAISKPDECNTNRLLCDNVNVEGTRNVVNAAKSIKDSPHIIYISSDFVLGEGGPHDETAVPAPLNYYGNSKLIAENIVASGGSMNTIIRPVFMYGETWQGMRSTFLHWVKQSLEEGKTIKVVSDQIRTPTYVVDVCKAINAVIEKKVEGLFHLGGEERVSPYEMAVRFSQLMGLKTSLIEAVTAETFAEPVQRAKQGGVLITKAKRELNYCPLTLQQGFVEVAKSVR